MNLEQQTGGMPLSAYIKSQVFSDDAETYRNRRKPADVDQKLMAEVLACLDSSGIANNLNQLAKATNTGALFCDADTKSYLNRACDDVRGMPLLLMEALGLQVEARHRKPESMSQSFARATTQNWGPCP